MKEIWKDIPGFEGLYQVSNLGRVKSLRYHKSKKAKVLSVGQNCCNYVSVELRKEGERYSCQLHRLVAQCFLPNPDSKPQVNHINGNKTDNQVTNLEWVTSRENVNHYWRKLKGKPYFLGSKRRNGWNRKKVVCVETGEVFESIHAAAQFAKVHDRLISAIVNGDPHRHRAGGYHWKLYQ